MACTLGFGIKIDIKININFDAKTQGARPLLGLVLWAGTPPGRRPRDPREGAQAPRDRPPGTHARVLNIKKSKELKRTIEYRTLEL